MVGVCGDLKRFTPIATEGLVSTAPVLTLWEGVIMYLTETAIDATVKCVRQYSAAGSQLALNYVMTGPRRRPTLLHRVTGLVGEPVRFGGWRPEDLPAWMGERGFQLLWDRSDVELARALLPEPWASGFHSPRSRVALAALPAS